MYHRVTSRLIPGAVMAAALSAAACSAPQPQTPPPASPAAGSVDRTVLPIRTPPVPTITEIDARKATAPPASR